MTQDGYTTAWLTAATGENGPYAGIFFTNESLVSQGMLDVAAIAYRNGRAVDPSYHVRVVSEVPSLFYETFKSIEEPVRFVTDPPTDAQVSFDTIEVELTP